jgi:lipopolysaccharide/colanic/teichoic acid biosynthesis glycosyltransferase
MRTSYARGGASRSAPRGMQKILLEEQIQSIIQRETSRADRTCRQFSVVLFSVKPGKRWQVSTCRMARVLLNRVRQTDDVGWFDERHLCAVLPDTPAAGARVFAARTCDEIALKQPRPRSIVYGYPGTSPLDAELAAYVGLAETRQEQAKSQTLRVAGGHSNGNGNGRHNGNAHGSNGHSNGHSVMKLAGEGNGNGNGHNGNGHESSIALVEAPLESIPGVPTGEREQLIEYFLDGVSSAVKYSAVPQPAPSAASQMSMKPDGALEDFFRQPMPWSKRCFDICCSTVGLVLLSPLFLVAAIAIKLTCPGPVIFKQKRSGLGGKTFTIYKFRTMCIDAESKQAELRKLNEQDGPAFKLTIDPRVTRIGKILRKTSIDELPQLFNVLLGNMSLVGPRPLPVMEQNGCAQWQRHRLNCTPGLTCIWQVDGRGDVTFDEWVRMDVAYMRRQTLWHDISILLRTIPAVLLRRGAK